MIYGCEIHSLLPCGGWWMGKIKIKLILLLTLMNTEWVVETKQDLVWLLLLVVMRASNDGFTFQTLLLILKAVHVFRRLLSKVSFNQEKAIVGAFSVLRDYKIFSNVKPSFEALVVIFTNSSPAPLMPDDISPGTNLPDSWISLPPCLWWKILKYFWTL